MFTNWLTDTTGLINTQSSANASTIRLPETNNHGSVAPTKSCDASTGLSLLSGHNNLANLNSNIMSAPPDIVLEVGPAPATVRFMAHGLVLGMHSGYLRSAIRFDERGSAAVVSSGGIGGGIGVSSIGDMIVYLTNVTAEQFAPLLTYMYTGYLDLNVENIFGVLLATHVLHMPRALEICRTYLARIQTEGYFGPSNAALNATNSPSNNSQIIRPIASKPQITNFGFVPMSQPPLTLNPITPNTNIPTTTSATITETRAGNSSIAGNELNRNEEDDDIEVDEIDNESINNENQIPLAGDEEEDVEVFIDSNSEAEVVVETQIQKLTFRGVMETRKAHNAKDTTKAKHYDKTRHKKSSHHNKTERRRKCSSGLQVAKAPIPASQLDCADTNKVIIDVASCDGPVRFKRILNAAYGHKPDPSSSANNHSAAAVPLVPERSLQSVSLSFHQQMAKTISQQQQLHHTEESENSETSNGSLGAPIRPSEKIAGGNRKNQSEMFVCVYCKHTFKSQYCYQKHAKRHLNPLTLQASCVSQGRTVAKEEDQLSSSGESQITKHQNINASRPFHGRSCTQYLATSPSVTPTNNKLTTSSDCLRREVRPLDMNVQYYPCKTCGCKFPSYYFVHKHRKMCHAEEEAQQTNGENNLLDSAAVGPPPANINGDEECLNSQSSD